MCMGVFKGVSWFKTPKCIHYCCNTLKMHENQNQCKHPKPQTSPPPNVFLATPLVTCMQKPWLPLLVLQIRTTEVNQRADGTNPLFHLTALDLSIRANP